VAQAVIQFVVPSMAAGEALGDVALKKFKIFF
jgi:hypothetical protein